MPDRTEYRNPKTKTKLKRKPLIIKTENKPLKSKLTEWRQGRQGQIVREGEALKTENKMKLHK